MFFSIFSQIIYSHHIKSRKDKINFLINRWKKEEEETFFFNVVSTKRCSSRSTHVSLLIYSTFSWVLTQLNATFTKPIKKQSFVRVRNQSLTLGKGLCKKSQERFRKTNFDLYSWYYQPSRQQGFRKKIGQDFRRFNSIVFSIFAAIYFKNGSFVCLFFFKFWK